MNLKTIKDRIIALLTDKSSGIQPEFQRQFTEIIKRIEEQPIDNHGECENPDELLKGIERCLLPDIIKFLESDKVKQKIEKWRSETINIKKSLKKANHME